MFAVASSSAGMAWQPVVVDTVTVSSIATSVVPTGPAIAYIDSANSVVKYVIATSSDGSWWGNPITLSPVSGLPTFVGLTSAAGAPCVAFQTAGDVVFMKSSTANGGDVASWPAPASVDGNYTTGGVAGVGAMSSIRGQPFLTWYDSTEYSVMYTTTNDAGDSWSEPIPLRCVVVMRRARVYL